MQACMAARNFRRDKVTRVLHWFLAAALALVATAAWASFHTFQIEEIFSNADGSVQYMVLHEAAGFNGQNFLAGHSFTSTQMGTTQSFTFSSDLPSSNTAGQRVLIASQGFQALGLVTPDYVLPNGFIPLTNGTINYAGVDQVSYAALPADSKSAINRSGMVIANLGTNFAGQSGSVTGGAPQTAIAVEYFYDVWNFYFETSFPAEIAALDGGAFGGVWKRTGQTFNVWPSPINASAVPTCRFFSTAVFAPKSSHFYTPFASECQFVKTNPADVAAWAFENIAFYIQLADANGLCGAGTIPLYRAFNNGMGGAPNHRYTTSLMILNQMIAAGWTFEGNGNTMVFACVPA
jgi:hypothetical protein